MGIADSNLGGCKVIGIDDLDVPIYRIFPKKRLVEVFSSNKLVLVPPYFWDDPFESMESKIGVSYRCGNNYSPQVIVGNGLPPIFAQSWSLTKDSDTLLRAYSRVVKETRLGENQVPDEEGVKVTSTPRKLIAAMNQALISYDGASSFIGQVDYVLRSEWEQKLDSMLKAHGTEVFKLSSNRANLLLTKRPGFSHEAEVRLIVALADSHSPFPKVLGLDVEVGSLIDAIEFDPRLNMSDINSREKEFRVLGYKGDFSTSDLYEQILFYSIIDVRELPA